ncbi:ArnT family glycosyltransferase [Magnetococcales bacterium HHB-1]
MAIPFQDLFNNINQKIESKTGSLLIAVPFIIIALWSLFIRLPDVESPINQPYFIGHADSAEIALLARNIAEGKGPVVDTVWLHTLGGMPGDDLPRGSGYWSPYHGYLLAIFFKIFGSSRETILIMAWFFQLLTALLVTAWVYGLTKGKLLSLMAFTTILLSRHQLTVNSGTFDIYLTFFLFAAFSLGIIGWKKESQSISFLSGLFSGITFCLKISGLLVPLTFFGYLLFSRFPKIRFQLWIISLIGIILATLPMIAYNAIWFDQPSPLPPALSLVSQAAKISKSSGDHNKGFYDPDAPPAKAPTFEQRQERFINSFFSFIDYNIKTGYLPYGLYLLLFIFILGIYPKIQWQRIRKHQTTSHDLFSDLSLLLVFGGVLMLGWIHYESRYFNFLVPFLTLMATLGLFHLKPLKTPVAFLIISLLMIDAWLVMDYTLERKQRLAHPSYHQVLKILPKEAKVLTSNPWEFAFHTRFPSVAVPYTDKEQTIQCIAKRYQTDYLVIVNTDARHSYWNRLEEGDFQPYPYLKKIVWSPSLVVAQFKSGICSS